MFKENITAVTTLPCSPDVLGVWAQVAQFKRDELRRQFGERIRR
jgi:hypothetical protein